MDVIAEKPIIMRRRENLRTKPAPFVRLMRNAKGLLPSQLLLVNELVLQIKHQPPADSSESAGTSTNTGMAAEAAQICDHPRKCAECQHPVPICNYGFTFGTKKCAELRARRDNAK
jgi:hypothetical protein